MIVQEGKLRLARRGADRRHHRLVQGGDRGERPLRMRGRGHPGRQFEGVADGRLEIRKVRAIEIGQRHEGHYRHDRRPSTAQPPSL